MIALMILMWTGNFIAAKFGLRGLDPLTLASLRVELAALILLAAHFAAGLFGLSGAVARTRLDRKDWGRYALLGIFGVVGNQMLFTIGLNYTTVGHSALIISTGPVTILLLARAMRLELLTVNKLLGMVLSFAGVAILAFEKGISLQGGTLKGDLITLSGSLAFAGFTVISKRVALRYDTFSMNLYVYLAGALLVLPVALWRAVRLHWSSVGWYGWSGLFYMALFGSVLAYLIFYWALRHLAPSRLAAFTYFQPILATLLGMVVLREQLTGHLLSGGVLVMFGVYLAERMPKGAPPNRE